VDSDGDGDPGNDPTVTNLNQDPQISLVKSASVGGTGNVGDQITYTFTVTNTGNVTVSGLAINDMTIGVSNLAVTPSTLLPGESGTATATYTITLTDMNNGSITNTALASGTDPNGDPVTDTSDTGTDPDGNPINDPELVDSDGDGDPGNDPTVTNLNQDPEISLLKSASVGGTGAVGDQITYTFVVTNTGNVTVSGLVINDATIGVSNLAVVPGTLLPGESGTATATYTITLADMNNGSITNTALASGTDPNGDPVTDDSDTGTDPDGNTIDNPELVDSDGDGDPGNDPTVTELNQDPQISLLKSASVGGTGAVGDQITYTFVVTNTGNVTVSGLVINDPIIGAVNVAVSPATLAPGQTGTATVFYTITLTDVANGSITNTATAIGQDPNGDPVIDISDTGTDPDGNPIPNPETVDSDGDGDPTNDPTVTNLLFDPQISLIKSASVGGSGGIGDIITYTFTVTNTGNTQVTNLVIDDATLGLSGLSVSPSSLAPGESGTANATYAITADDIAAGGVTNTALATGQDPNGDPVTDDSDTGTDPDGNPINDPETVDSDGDGDPTNDPTVTDLCPVIVAVQADDPTDCNVNDGKIIITAIGADLEYSIDGGLTFFDNNAFFGLSSGMYNVVVRSTLNGCQVPFGQVTLMSPTAPMFDNAIASTVSDCGAADGQIVIFASGGNTGVFEYSIDGGSTWSTSNIFNNLPEGFYPIRIRNADGTCKVAGPTIQLVPPAAPQIDFVSIKNPSGCGVNNGMLTVFASGGDPDLPLQYSINNGLSWTNNNMFSNLAEGSYEVRVRNGNGTCPSGAVTVTLNAKSNPVITDVSSNQPDCDELGSITVVADGGEVPGEYLISINGGMSFQSTNTGSYTFTGLSSGTYQIRVQNSDGSCEVSWPDVVLTSACIRIALLKSASLNDLNNDGFAQAGETITYTFKVTNTGTETVSNLVVNDPVLGLMNLPVAPATLAPNQMGTATTTYIITQADLDNGSLTNVATATGQGPNGEPVTDDSDTGTDPQGNPIDDPETVDSDGDGDPTNDPTVTNLPQNPKISLVKSAAVGGTGAVGDQITYTFTVTNTGNVTVSAIEIDDATIGVSGLAITPSTLAPGQSGTATATYTITQTDLDNGSITNTATATGTDPNGDPVSDDSDAGTDPDGNPIDDPETVDSDGDGDPTNDPTVTDLDQNPAISLVKSAAVGGTGAVGDQITYTFTVTNTGNVTVSAIEIDDATIGVSGLAITPSTLAPGQTGTATATYMIAQADLDNGSITNTATATGTDPNGEPVSDDSDTGTDPDGNPIDDPETVDSDGDGDPTNDPTVTDLDQNPAISLVKSAAVGGTGAVGDQITYTFTVTNTGNVTVSAIEIDDATIGVSGLAITPSTLAPGQTGTATATYMIAQADLDNGSITNTATATGTDPNGDPVSDDSDAGTDPDGNPIDDPETVDSDGDGDPGNDPTVTNLTQNPALYVSKVGVLDLGSNGVPDIGDVINYTIVVTNTGNVTISNITLADPNADPGSISCTPAEAFTLAPGESATCTAVHTLNADDLETRVVINVATATGQTPNGDPISQDSDDPQTLEPNDPTIIELPCVTIETWVYLEGAAILPDGSANYALPMRTSLNNLRLLPGQTYNDFFLGTFYALPGQPYNTAPWNYAGNEGDAFDSMGDLNFADADYPATVVDWVLVSLRDTPDGTGGPICQAAALLHNDGRVEFVGEFACCDIDLGASYYLVIEHRNHLIVMSHEPIPIANGKIVYDFRLQQSYINDPFLFGTFSGQKEILPGVFGMLGGNGNQALTTNSDTDINFDDRTFWESENGDIARYRNGDYNLNGDTNFNDRRVWELNNGKFTSVPRD
jgi:uncharacterized repeat protein (TIGR01451 family)